MGWANTSYLDAVLASLPAEAAYGKQALRRAAAKADIPEEALMALRRYSASEYAGQEDGKRLNAALAAGDGVHDRWAEEMDRAFVWSFDRDVILWRGFALVPMMDEASQTFVSTSLVERQARRFRSRGGSGLAAVLLPAGSRVAIPSMVWSAGDDERTLGVVRHEVEVILPRGTHFMKLATVLPFADRRPEASGRVHVYRAEIPEPAPERSFGF